MTKRKNEQVTVEKIKEMVLYCIDEEKKGEVGADVGYYIYVVSALKKNKDVTMAYYRQMEKEEFDLACEVFEEIVYHFQSPEMAELAETLYRKYYGDDTESDLYRECIANLRLCASS